ncbi:hypothetical protein [Undibacterium baiyunense]|uniref:Uncharacterized protein n=1 Tax=Undibacterium baiyunense TaxID=2828731 RepID=A0A941DGD9_9BURK|nr:hypothetical protein [Undibacterium baiyunense]MBR7748453.1 hypothetical protein [Undibacterium baiyunense]
MSSTESFAIQVSEALKLLSADEWALTTFRERAVVGITPPVAFETIVDILKVASHQNDQYAFATCCWLAMDFARISETTQAPDGLIAALNVLLPIAKDKGLENEISPLLSWYRLTLNYGSEISNN